VDPLVFFQKEEKASRRTQCEPTRGALVNLSSQFLLFPEKEAKSVVPLRGRYSAKQTQGDGFPPRKLEL
jgi:hypothetical protein